LREERETEKESEGEQRTEKDWEEREKSEGLSLFLLLLLLLQGSMQIGRLDCLEDESEEDGGKRRFVILHKRKRLSE